MKESIRWGILGCGDVTEIKSGPGFQKASDSSISACMRRDGEKAKDYAQRHGIENWYDRGEELIEDSQVDAVYVATPPYAHKEYVLKAAAAGKPVYVEKPPAMNGDDLQEMIDACKFAGVPLYVAYYRRGLPLFNRVKEIIQEGGIGIPRSMILSIRQAIPREIQEGKIPWRFDPSLAGGGLFMDLGCHQLDILDWILGPIKRATGFAVNRTEKYSAEDGLSAAFEFESGVIGTGLWDFTVAKEAKEDRIEITGSQGRLEFSAFAHQRLVMHSERGREEWTIPHPPHVQQPLIQSVVNDLTQKGTCPSTGESALRTARVMDTLLRDYYKN